MARYKHIDMSPRLLPVVLEDQLVPGSFANAVHHLVDQIDLSRFDTLSSRQNRLLRLRAFHFIKSSFISLLTRLHGFEQRVAFNGVIDA